MHDEAITTLSSLPEEALPDTSARAPDVVSTHVLVPEHQLERLRELSRRTRIHQSEYLREAVDDLLQKYGCLPKDAQAKESA